MLLIQQFVSWPRPNGCVLLLALLLIASKSHANGKISSLQYLIESMDFDPKLHITALTNNETYIKLEGSSPSQTSAYHLAEKIFHAKSLRPYRFVDVIPFWEREKFTIILQKSVKKKLVHSYVIFTSPPVREPLTANIKLKGLCSRDGGDVVISGDLQGKTVCIKGEWQLSPPPLKKSNLPIRGVSAHQIMINQDMVKDYRSFVVK